MSVKVNLCVHPIIGNLSEYRRMFKFPKSDIQTLCSLIFQIKNTNHVGKLLLRKQSSGSILDHSQKKNQF